MFIFIDTGQCRTWHTAVKCNPLTLQFKCFIRCTDTQRCVAVNPHWLMRLLSSVFCPLSSVRLPRFSFFSRDKQRGSQRNAHFDFGSWVGKDDVYTEQAQEALQHMWEDPHAEVPQKSKRSTSITPGRLIRSRRVHQTSLLDSRGGLNIMWWRWEGQQEGEWTDHFDWIFGLDEEILPKKK